MTKLNISLPETMKDFVEEQAAQRGYSTVSEYIRALIREAQVRAAGEVSEAKSLGGLNSARVSAIKQGLELQPQESHVSESIAALAMKGNPPPVPRDGWRQRIGLLGD